jgi:hypothetical protein
VNKPQIPPPFYTVVGLVLPRDYFPVKSWLRWVSLVISLLLTTSAAIIILLGIYDTVVATQQRGPAMIDDTLTGPLVSAVVLLVLGLLAGWSAFTIWKKGVVGYDGGFAYIDGKGLHSWSWDNVSSMTSAVTRHYLIGIYVGTSHKYTLSNRKNQRLVLSDSIHRVEELAKLIDQRIYPFLVQRATELYNAGQEVVFGPVRIGKRGFLIGNKVYPWTEANKVTIHQGVLKLSSKDGSWFSAARLSASNIPNLRILVTIVNQVKRGPAN